MPKKKTTETAIPSGGLYRVIQEFKKPVPDIQKMEKRDEAIAMLGGYSAWEALKQRIEERIQAVDQLTVVTENTLINIEDVTLHGFRCLIKDLMVEAYQSIIADVEVRAQIVRDREKEKNGTGTNN